MINRNKNRNSKNDMSRWRGLAAEKGRKGNLPEHGVGLRADDRARGLRLWATVRCALRPGNHPATPVGVISAMIIIQPLGVVFARVHARFCASGGGLRILRQPVPPP